MSMKLVAALAVAISLGGCIQYLQPGEVGTFRYFGEVRGNDPLPVLPPISDRDGNVYVLAGAPDLPEVDVFVGHAGGGWSGGCGLHDGERGVHGWVGATDDRAWYHSGDALVEVSGETGSCQRILESDPSSGTALAFLGVLPHVEESPSRTYLLALIQGPADPRPYFVTVDLDLGVYTEIRSVDEGSEFSVLGTGWDTPSRTGVYLVRYEIDGGSPRTEAWFLDPDGAVTATVRIDGGAVLEEDAVLGWLQFGAPSPVAGLLSDGRIVIFTRDEGEIRENSQLELRGVHRWEDRLWLVGLGTTGDPMLSEIDSRGDFSSAIRWDAAKWAGDVLDDEIDVLDDTVAPSRMRTWDEVRAVPGEFPFLHAHPPHPYAQGTTLLLAAGPSFEHLDVQQTSTAFAPVGISYP
jgi:hypothetical protein